MNTTSQASNNPALDESTTTIAQSPPSDQQNSMSFIPARGLENPHLQTILSSVGRKLVRRNQYDVFNQHTDHQVIEVLGVKLAVDINQQQAPDAPMIIIVPGWLGSSTSAYALSAAHLLFQQGYTIARINLRDHGNTAHLNSGMFNSALIEEVVELVHYLIDHNGQSRAGLIGYSLGGNFALRLAKAIPELDVLAICPAIEPADTMYKIDSNIIYQRYFVNKWRKVWAEKQKAFPRLYNFDEAMQLSTVSALTDYFLLNHSDFSSADSYFAAYDLSGDTLASLSNSKILAAQDDPIIPYQQWRELPANITVDLTKQGGHGAYLSTWQFDSWADQYAANYFNHIYR